MSYFVYDYSERWITVQERIADATIESCDTLVDFRDDVKAVVVAHDLTKKTFTDWLNGNTTIEDIKLAIDAQGTRIKTLQQKVK